MQVVLEGRVDEIELLLVDRERRVAPRRCARENKFHDVADERVAKVGLNADW